MKKIAVIGLGYVGLPVAIEFGKTREVVGFDINTNRIDELKNRIDITKEVNESDFIESSYLSFTTNLESISDCNIFIVTVPTPIDSANQPNLIKKNRYCHI